MQMKSRISKRHPLNMHLVRAAIAEGVSKQNSHLKMTSMLNFVLSHPMHIKFIEIIG